MRIIFLNLNWYEVGFAHCEHYVRNDRFDTIILIYLFLLEATLANLSGWGSGDCLLSIG